jgi:hypothetical protein
MVFNRLIFTLIIPIANNLVKADGSCLLKFEGDVIIRIKRYLSLFPLGFPKQAVRPKMSASNYLQ